MKKSLLITLTILISTTAMGQYKGNVLLAGGINYAMEKDPTSVDQTDLYINPGVGYCLSDNWAAGVFANYHKGVLTNNVFVGSKLTGTYLGFGPFVRYTQMLSNTFFVLGQLELARYSGKRTNDDGTIVKTTNTTMYSASFFPMVGINVYNGFNLNFGIGGVYFQNEKTSASATPIARAGLNFGKTVQITIGKFFGRRKESLFIQ